MRKTTLLHKLMRRHSSSATDAFIDAQINKAAKEKAAEAKKQKEENTSAE